jgi:hypothetical protein
MLINKNNNMKKIAILASLVLMSLVGFSQTKTGLYVVPFTAVTDVRVEPIKGRLGAEVGYFGQVFGLTGTVETNSKLNSEALVGLKGYASVANFENLSLKAAVGASTYAKDLKDSEWRFTPELSLSAPLFNNLDARVAGQAHFYTNTNWKVYPGVSFGLAYKL